MIEIRRRPELSSADLNSLFAKSWPDHSDRDFGPVLSRSLSYVAAFDSGILVGFLNVAWDGGAHGFVLDVTVSPDYRRRGIALNMLDEAKRIALEADLEWLHVDFEESLTSLYRTAGYRPTAAGLVHLPSCAAV